MKQSSFAGRSIEHGQHVLMMMLLVSHMRHRVILHPPHYQHTRCCSLLVETQERDDNFTKEDEVVIDALHDASVRVDSYPSHTS